MQNEHQIQPSDEANAHFPQRLEDRWSEFERELETLGHHLSELWSHKAVLGDDLIRTIQAQYTETRIRANVWKHATEQQISEIRRTTREQIGGSQASAICEHGRRRPLLKCGNVQNPYARVLET